MGALALRPRLVHAFAAAHPPAWFVDAGALGLMRALFCIATGNRKAAVDDLIETLDRHDALALAGGPDAVRSLVARRPELDAALLELDEILARLPPAERELIARAEDLDDLEEMIESGVELTASPAPAPYSLERVSADEQLTLFHERPLSEEDDHA